MMLSEKEKRKPRYFRVGEAVFSSRVTFRSPWHLRPESSKDLAETVVVKSGSIGRTSAKEVRHSAGAGRWIKRIIAM